MVFLDRHIGQAGNNPEVFGHHPLDPNRHRYGAAALAFIHGGPKEAQVVFNLKHHTLTDYAGESGLVYRRDRDIVLDLRRREPLPPLKPEVHHPSPPILGPNLLFEVTEASLAIGS